MLPLRCGAALVLAAIFSAPPATALDQLRINGVDKEQVRVWNLFVERLQRVHDHLLQTRHMRTVEQSGGYQGFPDFYREVSYLDAETGRLLSRIQRERDAPDRIHSIEIYFYHPDGRVARDYSATFLPGFRNAPVQTLINLHGYEAGLHAYRQFDASGSWIYEQCRGSWFDRDVEISNELPGYATSPALIASEEYIACFGLIPSTAGAHIDPTNAVAGLALAQDEVDAHHEPEDALQKRIALYSTRLLLLPRDAATYLKRADAYLETLDFERAITDYSKAIELDAKLDQAYLGRGLALGRQGAIDEGIADLTTYIERNPKSSLAYTKRGVRHIWKRDFERAEADLEQAIALDPNNAEAHDDLGVVLANRRDYAGAARHFETTIRLDASYQKAYHNLALVRHLEGHNQDALTTLDRGLSLSARHVTRSSLQLKANILVALGRHGEAAAAKREAAALPDFNWSEQLLAR